MQTKIIVKKSRCLFVILAPSIEYTVGGLKTESICLDMQMTILNSPGDFLLLYFTVIVYSLIMETEPEDIMPESAFDKDPFQMTVEDVYDISHVIGQDLLHINKEARGVSDIVAGLQFKIVRVLEVLETLVNQSSLTAEELKMERDNLKAEVERLLRESSQPGQVSV